MSENLLTITPQATATKDVEETIKIVLTSSKNYIRIVSIEVKQLSSEAGAEAGSSLLTLTNRMCY
ncbi:hypothetical protein SFC43_23170 [Bacteroides sp. CR5/BHMF/2]|nr:hypothetical protein [Bacteroides sp. CR5/BHMF/2]